MTLTRRHRRPVPAPAAPVLLIVLVLSLLVAGCAGDPDAGADPDTPTSRATEAAADPNLADGVRVVAVGDISCAPGIEPTEDECQQGATAKLAAWLNPARVLALGDLQYERGTREEFLKSWSESWGRFREIILPVPGNHEYYTDGAADYLDWFGTSNFYVEEVGDWRVYLLDSNCEIVSCAEQAEWLADDLALNPTTCAAAVMHHPRFSSGSGHGSQEQVQPLWEAAVAGGVDLVLAGHDHDYERFAPIGPSGEVGEAPAARSFVVGTGGKSLYNAKEPIDGSEALYDDEFGVLELTLAERGYGWRFVTIDNAVLDSGSALCGSTPRVGAS